MRRIESSQAQDRLSKRTVLLLGSGRSGTTWLAGLLAGAFRYRLLFEPFHPDKVAGSDAVADRFFEPDAIPARVAEHLTNALDDRLDSLWIACNSNRRFGMHRWRWWPRVRICKSIRTNLLLPTYRELFGDQLAILVLVRHPGAVAESFLRVNFPWAFDLSTLLEPKQRALLERKHELPLDRLVPLADSKAGAVTLRWIVENAWVLKSGHGSGHELAFYEDLMGDPTRIAHLFRRLNLKAPGDLERRIHRHSWTTHPRSPLKDRRAESRRWDQRLDRKDVARIEEMLDVAGIDYSATPAGA